MKIWIALLLLLNLPLVSGQDTSPSATLVFVADGHEAAYRPYLSAEDDWFSPDAAVNWSIAPAGFGPRSHFTEVSTVASFQAIHLRQWFDVAATPETLTLSLKHDAGELAVYLNGERVVSRTSVSLPAADSRGFRHYDLTAHIPALTAAKNLLAIRTTGSIAVPILHGTTRDLTKSAVAFDPTALRCAEGETSVSIRILRRSPDLQRTYLDLSNDSNPGDFAVTSRGQEIPVDVFQFGRRFRVAFSGEETEVPIHIRILDDVHAEGLEAIRFQGPSGLSLLIPPNDTVVTRTSAVGEGSLRQAIENAENLPGLETITFSDEEGVPFSLAPVTVVLGNGSPSPYGAREGFTIEGPPSPGRVTIQGTGGPLFSIAGANGTAASQDLTLRRLVIRGASVAVQSMRYEGSMLIEDCEFIGNQTALDLYGRSSAPIVRRCLFEGNTEHCIRQYWLSPVIENCTFTGNEGVCLDMLTPSPLKHCTFAANHGAISSRPVQFTNCLLTGEIGNLGASTFDRGGNLFVGLLRDGEPISPDHPGSLAVASPAEAGLGELDFHGGFTRTIPISANSPALDLGLPAETPAFDQRGEPFRRHVGLAPDAGAYELQFSPDDLAIGLTIEPGYDAASGLYFQLVIVHNDSPWTQSGFRLAVSGLPAGATLYNSSGDGFIDVAGPMESGDYRIVILQYSANLPDLRLTPVLAISLPPVPDPTETMATRLEIETGGGRCLHFPTEPGGEYQVEVSADLSEWRPAGPAIFAESSQIMWRDGDPAMPEGRFYRLSELD
ncbi:right-handed parallel beta-helix repeat-containing protein [Haloferula sargassicola]|uniref:Right handed beta helix domain-containing protein n=1 Tax=Haloferula sargassicola TaxID=490096 RepID=A0ABP9UN87_9BACT